LAFYVHKQVDHLPFTGFDVLSTTTGKPDDPNQMVEREDEGESKGSVVESADKNIDEKQVEGV
jgi:hypothetical protein